MNDILDHFTYREMGGRRRLRTFSKAAIFILLIVVILGSYAVWQRADARAEVMATPRPVSLTSPTATPVPASPTAAAVETCPSDPEQWTLADVPLGGNLKRIEPACVYDGLGRAMAWALAVREGYTRREATQLLGFSDVPVEPRDSLTILTNTEGPLSVPLTFPPLHPDYAEWRVRNGAPAMTYSLRGCFRTYEIVGNQRREWGEGYVVICTLVEDSEAAYSVMGLGDHLYSASVQPLRKTVFFGYRGRHAWIWLGAWKDVSYSLDQKKAGQDRALVSNGYGAPIWNAAWLEKTYGLAMVPLPANWWTYTDNAELQAIVDALNSTESE